MLNPYRNYLTINADWPSENVNYYTDGSTSTDGKALDNRLKSWRVGAALAFLITRQLSTKLYGSTSIYSRIGSDFDIVGVAW